MNKKRYLLAFVSPWLVMLCAGAIGASAHEASARTFTDSICAFMLIYLLLYLYAADRREVILTTLAVVAGYLTMMIPLYFNFTQEHFAQADIFIVLVSMVLSAVCYHTRRISVFLLSVMILLLLNTYGVYAWMGAFKLSL